ncbi:MAG: phosphohistidine phosphatase SixA [Myxococcota bacterium]|jgi:phosphohistidine phosphatase SixA
MGFTSYRLIVKPRLRMAQTFIFIRHGTIPIKATATRRLPKLARRGLSEGGITEARAAGRFVQQRLSGQTVDRLLIANSERARQTAALVFEPLPAAETAPMFSQDPLSQLNGWLEGLGPEAVVVRVGHGPAFLATLSVLSPTAPDFSLVFGAVLVAVRAPTWRLDALLPVL